MTSGPDQKLLPLRIRLPYATEEEFVQRYGANIERGGVFIATRSVKPEGTGVSFELVLQDGTRLMRGEGVVAGTVTSDEPGKSGMTLRFTRLESRTKALVDRVLLAREGRPAADLPLAEPSAPEPPRPAVALRGAPPNLGDDVVLGIDLGTTTCRAALVVDGTPRLVPLGDAQTFALPSMTGLAPDGQIVVGHAAEKLVAEHPQRVAVGLKRLLGRRAASRRVRDYARRTPYKVVSDPDGDAGVEIEGQTFTAHSLTAALLGQLKACAQEVLGRELHRAVVGVPAWYNDHQRQAVLDAAREAGLDVLRLLNEPTAVALAFGHGRGLARKRLLVYDLGGGTFDASVVELTGDELEVISTGGDAFLGGLDFDETLTQGLVGTLAPDARATLEGSRVAWLRVRRAAEAAKIALSDTEETRVRVPFAATDARGSPVDVQADVSRTWLEQMTRPLVDRTTEITRVVLEVARLTPQMVDEALLVGGQSRAPLVRRQVEALLGRAPRTDVDPQGAVAIGAALLGWSLVQRERGKPGAKLSEVLSAPLGVAVRGGGMRRVLERNTRLPAEKTLAVPVEAGEPVQLAVFQGTAAQALDNDYLGAVQLQAERAGELVVRFKVSQDGVLDLRATAPGAREERAVLATADAGDETVEAILAASPLPGEEPGLQATPSGIFRSLKRLFGR